MKKNISLIIILLLSLSIASQTTLIADSQYSPMSNLQFPSIGGIISTMLTPSNYSVTLYAENSCIKTVIRLGINPFLLSILNNSSILVTSSIENNTLIVDSRLLLKHDFISVLLNDTNIEYNASYEFSTQPRYREDGVMFLRLTNSSSHILIEGQYNITGSFYDNVIFQGTLHITGYGGYIEIIDKYLSNSSQITLLVEQLENLFNARITRIETRKINNTYYIVSINASLYARPTIPSNIVGGTGEETLSLSGRSIIIDVNAKIYGELRTFNDYLSALKFSGHMVMLSGTRIPNLLGFEYNRRVESSQLEKLLLCGDNELYITKNGSYLEIQLPSVSTENQSCNNTVKLLADNLLSLGLPRDTPVSLVCRDYGVTQKYTLSEINCACSKDSTLKNPGLYTSTNDESTNTMTTITTTSRSNNTLYAVIGIAIVILLGILSFYKRQ